MDQFRFGDAKLIRKSMFVNTLSEKKSKKNDYELIIRGIKSKKNIHFRMFSVARH